MKTLCVTGESARSRNRFDALLLGLSQDSPDYFEVRDRSASDRTLLGLLAAAKKALPRSLVLANDRFDLALAAGADGVILPESGLPVEPVRRETPRGFLVGKSTHSIPAALRAAKDGADLVLLGPIFDTPSKRSFGAPLSPGALSGLPERGPEGAELFLIGGIDESTLPALLSYRSRFTGIAAIRLFEESMEPGEVVRSLRTT
jgi:thiamine-phosphate pyrophosphorylase